MTVFEDRDDAGRRLGETLAGHPLLADAERVVVLAIPRGGLAVGVQVARRLDAALDVAVVRRLRSPHNSELAFGAVGADGHVDLDEDLVAELGLSEEEVRREVADRSESVRRRVAMYRETTPQVPLDGAVAVVVDDGIASGGTATEACLLARRSGAATVLLAVPVAPAAVVEELGGVADALVVLSQPEEFMNVDQAYKTFTHVDDGDVSGLLAGLAPG